MQGPESNQKFRNDAALCNHNPDDKHRLKITGDGMKFETLAIHAGQEPDPNNGAVMTPVYFTSTYMQDAVGHPRQG